MKKRSRILSKIIILCLMAGSFSVLSSCSVLRPLDNTKRNESETVIISNPADTLESEKNVPPEKSIEQEDITVEITKPIHEEAVAWVQYYEVFHAARG